MKTVTLANLAECSKQEIFDHVARTMKAQGFVRSMGEYAGKCAYRSNHFDPAEGLRCAAGACMTDEEYTTLNEVLLNYDQANAEGSPWDGLVRRTHKSVFPITREHMDFIGRLQAAHDNGSNPDAMKAELILAADEAWLDHSVLDGE